MKPSPLLAIDLASSSACAVLQLPEEQGGNLFAFRSPAPGKTLAARVRECTALRRPLYLSGGVLDGCIVPPLLAHLRAGLSLRLHPAYASLLSARPEKLLGMGVEIGEVPQEKALALEFWDVNPEHWSKLMETAGLPKPGAIYACASESGHLLDDARPRPLAPLLGGLFERHGGGIPVQELLCPTKGPEMLRLSTIQRITGFSVLDSALAFVAGMFALPSVAARSRREGVVLLYMGRHYMRAALAYRGRLFALLELPASPAGQEPPGAEDMVRQSAMPLAPESLAQWLDDLRLGWLPAEKAENLGGFLCRAGALPAEAEGFRPLFITGPGASALEGMGRIVDSGPEESANCRGLLAAFGSGMPQL